MSQVVNRRARGRSSERISLAKPAVTLGRIERCPVEPSTYEIAVLVADQARPAPCRGGWRRRVLTASGPGATRRLPLSVFGSLKRRPPRACSKVRRTWRTARSRSMSSQRRARISPRRSPVVTARKMTADSRDPWPRRAVLRSALRRARASHVVRCAETPLRRPDFARATAIALPAETRTWSAMVVDNRLGGRLAVASAVGKTAL